MVRARINHGRIEAQDPIPDAWNGQTVKLIPLTPDDPTADLEEQLAALHAMGPMEFQPGEREESASLLEKMNQLSKESMNKLSRKRR